MIKYQYGHNDITMIYVYISYIILYNTAMVGRRMIRHFMNASKMMKMMMRMIMMITDIIMKMVNNNNNDKKKR